MKKFDVYGFKTNDLELVKSWIEPIIGFLKPCESSYIGEYYRLDVSSTENYVLQPNYCDEDWTEEEYQDCEVILHVNQALRGDEIREKITSLLEGKVEFIRRTVVTEDRWNREYKYIDGKDILVFERNLAELDAEFDKAV
jgi:hypothetical protein